MTDQEKGTPAQQKEKLQFPFSEEDWANTPASVQQFLFQLIASNAALEKRIEELEKRLNKNSKNSNKPPSSDSPFGEKPKKTKKSKSKKKKRRKGFRQKMLEPTEVKNVIPEVVHMRQHPF